MFIPSVNPSGRWLEHPLDEAVQRDAAQEERYAELQQVAVIPCVGQRAGTPVVGQRKRLVEPVREDEPQVRGEELQDPCPTAVLNLAGTFWLRL